VSLTKNNGQVYEQIDDVRIIGLALYAQNSLSFFATAGWPAPTNPSAGACLIGAFVQRAGGTTGAPPVNTNGWVSKTEMRAGDRISFHQPTLLSLIQSPDVTSNKYASTYLNLFNWMLSNDATIVYTSLAEGPELLSDNQTPWLNTIVFPYDIAGYDGYINPSNLLNQSAFPVTLGPDPVAIAGLNALSPSNSHSIPIMNNNMQASFAFELTCLVPDVTSLSSTPPR
jgi:hypothetical protein